MQSDTHLTSTLDKLDALPAMPAIAQKLLTLPLNTNEGEDAMLRLIEHDPQLSAKIIGLANTPILGSSHQTTSVRDAAMRLGMTRVKSIAIGMATMSALTQMPQGRLCVQDLWLHSLAVAMSMRTIAQYMPEKLRPDDGQIFLAGLLHDIGYLVLAYLDTKRSDELHTRMAANPNRPILELELELLNITHSELGAQLGHNWGLPRGIITALRYHHTPDSPEAAEGLMLIRLINIAEKILPVFGISELLAADISDQEWMSLNIAPEKQEEIRGKVLAQAEQAKQLAIS